MILVQHIIEDARRHLAVLSQDAPVCEAADILANQNTPLVVICNRVGVAVGVISRTDIIKALSRGRGEVFNTRTEAIMSSPVQFCMADQTVQAVWESLGSWRVRCVPVLDAAHRPQGVVHARDLARSLLEEVENEEVLLRDYVLGVGYQ